MCVSPKCVCFKKGPKTALAKCAVKIVNVLTLGNRYTRTIWDRLIDDMAKTKFGIFIYKQRWAIEMLKWTIPE